MEVIITGGSGFVGRNLLAYFGEKYTIQSISIRTTEWKETLNVNADAIIHLAGKAHDVSNTSNPEEYFTVNRDLTISLFDEFLKSNIKDFVYFSSVKSVRDTVDGTLTEDVVPDPKTAYGKSKLEAEQYLQSKLLPVGKRLFIIRPCMIHGPGNKGNLNLLFNVVKMGLPWPLAAFENQRSFLNVSNLCFLIDRMLLSNSVRSGVYNFSDDIPLSTNELISLISNCLGKPVRLVRVNKSVLFFLAKIGDYISLPLNSDRLKKLSESYVVSNQKIKTELQIHRLPIDAVEGLKKTIMSFDKSKK